MRFMVRVLGFAALLAAATTAQAGGAACVHHPAYGNDPFCVLFGDLDGDGQAEPVQFHAGVFAFGALGQGPVQLGQSGDYPLLGDWNGDGRDTIGLYRNGQWLLTNDSSYLSGRPSRLFEAFAFGSAAHTPVTGDWNGDGVDTAGILSSDGTFTLTDAIAAVRETLQVSIKGRVFGPVAGDFDRDGDAEVGIIDGFGRFAFVDNVDIAGSDPGVVSFTGTNPCFETGEPGDIGITWPDGGGLTGITLDLAEGIVNVLDAGELEECPQTEAVIIEIIP